MGKITYSKRSLEQRITIANINLHCILKGVLNYLNCILNCLQKNLKSFLGEYQASFHKLIVLFTIK